MRSYRQRFLNMLTTFEALLCRVVRVDSDDLTTSTRSLVCQNTQKRAPRGIQNALCQFRSRQTTQVQVFDNDQAICVYIAPGGLEMKVAALALDLLMRLCRAARHLTAATAALHSRTQSSLLAAQARLTGPKETWVLNHVAVAIGKKHLQSHVNTDRWPVINGMRQVANSLLFTHDQRIPMTIGPLDQVAGFWRPFHLAVALDLDCRAELARDAQQSPIKPYILAFGELAQVDAMPLIAAPKARKTPSIGFIFQEVLEGFREAVSQALNRGRRNCSTTSAFEQRGQIVLAQKLTRFLIVLLLMSKHLVIQQARLIQARIKATALISVRIEAELKGLHMPNDIALGANSQTFVRIPEGWPFAIHLPPEVGSPLVLFR